jgi:threonine/homoserine/homoserine lactone efflux protein
MLVFEATFLALAFTNALGYAIVASRARRIAGNPTAIAWFNRTGGTLLIGAGLATARAASS